MNRFKEKLDSLIKEYQNMELKNFTGMDGKKAKFTDTVWYYNDPDDGRVTRFLAIKKGARIGNNSQTSDANISDNQKLSLYKSYLVKFYIIEVASTSISQKQKKRKVAAAREFLTSLDVQIYDCNRNHFLKISLVNSIPFVRFCQNLGVLPKFALDLIGREKRDRSGSGISSRMKEKIPDESALYTTGAIHNELFSNVDQDGSIKPGVNFDLPNSFVITGALLGLAAPNRLAAEVFTLNKQKLHVYTPTNQSESDCDPVYYLNWKGSKGFQNYNNHILSVAAKKVEHSVNFFNVYCERYRRLCFYYENPDTKLCDLVSGLSIDTEIKNNLEPYLDKSPSIFQLGYALGFYSVDEEVLVVKPEFAECINQRGPKRKGDHEKYLYRKPVYKLTSGDLISTARSGICESFSILFGCSLTSQAGKKNNALGFDTGSWYSVSFIQEWWIQYFTNVMHPSFPYSYTSSENKVKLSNALFCIPHSMGMGKSRGVMFFAKSYYSIAPIATLAARFTRKLTGASGASIWEDYGYSSDISLKPSSLRHLSNTLASMSDIPNSVITVWSGRKNPEQTKTYIHDYDEIHSDRLRSIYDVEGQSSKSIRVISADEIKDVVHLPATVTSTGICTQELTVTPCGYLNDFVSQCFMCGAACHVAGDSNAITFLEKDLECQRLRLNQVLSDERLPGSKAQQSWVQVHATNSTVLETLIKLMKEQKEGSVIRYNEAGSAFQITDMKTMKIKEFALELPDPKKMIIDVTKGDHVVERNQELSDLLKSFGI